jgi:putative addiction module CopG family antidote
MAVRLSPQLQHRIDEFVKSGQFANADAVVEAALQRLAPDDDEYWDDLEAYDAEADADVANGRVTRIDEGHIQMLRDRVRQRAADDARPG